MTDFDHLETPLVTRWRRVGKRDPFGKDERTIQREIVKAGRKLGFRITAVRNGVGLRGDGRARMLQGVAARADGVETGFPDLICQRPANRGGPEVAFIEVKRPGGELSPEQIEIGERCRRDGVRWAVVCSCDEAFAVWTAWGWIS